MTTQGALRAGAGLVEVFVPEEIYEIVAAAAPMEAMVRPIKSYRDLLKEKSDVWALGPGLGKSRAAEILDLIEKAKQLMVVDADGLNILADKIAALRLCKGERLLTPHPGEMKRLFPDKKETRAKTATRFCNRFPVTLLLKGSRTIGAERDRPLSYNTTGNPGMASGGMATFSPASARDWPDKGCPFTMQRDLAHGYAGEPRKSRFFSKAPVKNRCLRVMSSTISERRLTSFTVRRSNFCEKGLQSWATPTGFSEPTI